MITRLPERNTEGSYPLPIQGRSDDPIQNGGEYKYETYIATDTNVVSLQKRAIPIYQTFRRDPMMAVDRVRARITEGSIVRFAVTKKGRSIGFISYYMRDIKVDDQSLSVADISTIVVVPEHQKSGIATHFFKDIAEENVPDASTGVVQEPFTHVAKLRTGYFDMGDRKEDDEYPLTVVRPLIKVLEIDITIGNEPINRIKQVTDWRYGICAGYFPLDDRARLLMIDGEKHPEAHNIYAAWLRTGFQPKNGDGKRYWLPTVKERIIPRQPQYIE